MLWLAVLFTVVVMLRWLPEETTLLFLYHVTSTTGFASNLHSMAKLVEFSTFPCFASRDVVNSGASIMEMKAGNKERKFFKKFFIAI